MTTGYSHCAGCGLEVIDERICCYCEENRKLYGMHDVADLTRNELDTLGSLGEYQDTYPEPKG